MLFNVAPRVYLKAILLVGSLQKKWWANTAVVKVGSGGGKEKTVLVGCKLVIV